jgi:hypothetical protein
MSARQRHHKARIREAEYDLAENKEDQAATERVMAYLLEHGHDKMSIAYHTLEHVLVNLKHDRAALIEVMKVLAPNEWRWQLNERWRETP